MSKVLVLTSLLLSSFFIQGSLGPVLLPEIWNKIFSFCDFEEVISLQYLNKNFHMLINQTINQELENLKNMIKANNIASSNFFAAKLQSLDEKIVLQNALTKNNSFHNTLCKKDQERINLMRYLIHCIVDKDSFKLPLNNRGTSSDFIAEKLGLKNYFMFYDFFCFQSCFSLATQHFSSSKDFKRATYEQYQSLIDPYFKIKFVTINPPHKITSSHKAQGCMRFRHDNQFFNFESTAHIIFVPFMIIMQAALKEKTSLKDQSDILIDFEPKNFKNFKN